MNTRLSDRGYSITELLLVVAFIALISAIAVPTFSDVHVRRLQVATSQVVMALRFARQEAIRTGVPHGVRKIQGQNRISVFKLDMGPDWEPGIDQPIDLGPAAGFQDVQYPVGNSPIYLVDLENDRRTLATTVVAYFRFLDDPVVQQAVSFDGRGEPVDGTTGKPLSRPQGGFLLTNGDRGAVVSLSWLSGRVASGEIGGVISDPTTVF